MISIQLIRDHPEAVRRALLVRNVSLPLDRIIELDGRRRDLIKQVEELKAERNTLTRSLGRLAPSEREVSLDRSRSLSGEIDVHDGQLRETESELNGLMMEMPNIPDLDVPIGLDETANVVVRVEGERKDFAFEPKPHWEIGEALGILDFEAGVKLAGSRFYVLRGAGARLQRALIAFMLDLHVSEHGYTELYLPYVLREENLYQSGHLPKFRDTMYHDSEDDFWFIPTAEASFANLHAGEILDVDSLPIRYVTCTACFRREKASAGRDVRGIKRGHQFDKVEMFRFCLPEESEAHLTAMIGDGEDVLSKLGLQYRLLQLCTGDIDFKATKSFDLEVWAPGSGEWFEVSSASNCSDFQARRANIRFRREPGAPTEFVHMLNASGVALPRLFAALLEVGQQADGSVRLPGALAPYFGPDLVIRHA